MKTGSINPNKFHEDKEFRRLAGEFFATAEAARCKSPEEVSTMDDTALEELIKRCLKLAGKNVADERDIGNIAWHCATDSNLDMPARVNALAAALGAVTSTVSIYVAPNYAVTLTGDIRRFVIGPVQVRFTQDLAQEIADITTDRHWQIVRGSRPGVKNIDGKEIATLPYLCWKVDVAASQANVPTAAIWLINTAVSLLRLSLPRPVTSMTTLTPDFGDIEPHPTRHSELNQAELTVTERQVWVEGRSDLGPQYWITEELVSHLEASGFADRAATLFAPPNGSIAERLAQGLGWLARGRQARDRPERMLFFFTAIEALLSDGDKASPVVDRIARDAATILIPDFTERHALARDIKKWYGIRSELVHGGRRNVSSSEADRVQALAEILYISVLEKVDLTTKADTFRADVVQAGYGASWPPQR